jgi:hypothetical protein
MIVTYPKTPSITVIAPSYILIVSYTRFQQRALKLTIANIHCHPFNPPIPFISLNPQARIVLNPLANNASK